jgi:hypothetical protein
MKAIEKDVFVKDDAISNDEVLAAIGNNNFDRALKIVDSIDDPVERVRQRNKILAIKERGVI